MKSPLNDKNLWEKKAVAFVTRSHRQLWGKNNEDPLAFLFECGLENQFAKDLLMGWNKFGQYRFAENWGFKTDSQKSQKIFFPAGIVVPYIVKKRLLSVFIHSFDGNKANKTILLNGSSSPTIILGNHSGEKIEKIAFVSNLFDGFFLFQEIKKSGCVVIHPDMDIPVDKQYTDLFKDAATAFIFSGDITQNKLTRHIFSDIKHNCFYTYKKRRVNEFFSVFLSYTVTRSHFNK